MNTPDRQQWTPQALTHLTSDEICGWLNRLEAENEALRGKAERYEKVLRDIDRLWLADALTSQPEPSEPPQST
jgi:hypothetical protein